MERPNIIMILTDDQGAWAMGCAGNRDVKTPNLDRLAEEGVRFENFFCASPVCSPARGTIFTGRMPSAHGVLDWIRGGNVDRERLKEKSGDPYYRNEDRGDDHLYRCSGTGGLHMLSCGQMASGRQSAPAARLFEMVYNRQGRVPLQEGGCCGKWRDTV